MPYNFTLSAWGPRTATPGHSLYFMVNTNLIEGENKEWWDVEFLAPTGFNCSLTGRGTHPSWGNKLYRLAPFMVRVDVPVQVGTTDNIRISVRVFKNNETTSYNSYTFHDIVIEAEQEIPYLKPLPVKSSANIQKWEENLFKYGPKASAANNDIWDGGAWFYDGAKVFDKAYHYTKNSEWLLYANKSNTLYASYVQQNAGKIAGYRVFTEGLFAKYKVNQSLETKTRIIELANNSPYAAIGGEVDPDYARETAFILKAYLDAQKCQPEVDYSARIAKSVDLALGHIDIWCDPTNTRPLTIKPFMVGLTMNALITYHEKYKGDVRVYPAIYKACEFLWSEFWIPANGFSYSSKETEPAPDLNLLIAPAYMWLARVSGKVFVLARADDIFNAGVNLAYLDGGKQFTQNYCWSFDFVEWSKITAEPAPPVTRAEFENYKKITDERLRKLESA